MIRNLIFLRFHLLLFAVVAGLALPTWSNEQEIPISSPGYRPGTVQAVEFLDALDSTTIAVYPSIIRRATRTAHSHASQKQLASLLQEKGIAKAAAVPTRIDLGAFEHQPQHELFLSDMERIAEAVKGRESDMQYHLALEFLLPVNDQIILGIQCYVLDKNGDNVFSFLLNQHHRVFVEANLTARNSSEEARSEMFARATEIAATALAQQIGVARGHAPGVRNVDYHVNELPMYGMREKTEQQKRADEHYIRYMTRDGRTRADAANTVARVAWKFFYEGDKATAIKRFNQAWLLDPKNQLALWGFAVTCVDRGQLEDAARYYEMAIDSGPENPRLQIDYEITLGRLKQ